MNLQRWRADARKMSCIGLLGFVCGRLFVCLLFAWWKRKTLRRTKQRVWTVFTLRGPGFLLPPVSMARWRAGRKRERGGGTQISDTSPTFGSRPTAMIWHHAWKTVTTASRFHAATGFLASSGEIHGNHRRPPSLCEASIEKTPTPQSRPTCFNPTASLHSQVVKLRPLNSSS